MRKRKVALAELEIAKRRYEGTERCGGFNERDFRFMLDEIIGMAHALRLITDKESTAYSNWIQEKRRKLNTMIE